MEPDALDLNLLVALDALLRLRSVTAAAERLAVSQSTMSGMLARLRRQIGDPLLTRSGNGMTPTTRGEAMAGEVRQILMRIEAMSRPEPELDLAKASRRIRIMASEHGTLLILPDLVRRASREAPGLCFDVSAIDAPAQKVTSGEVDLCLTGDRIGQIGPAISDVLRTRTLLADPFLAIVDNYHSAPHGAITLDELRRYPHVVSRFPGIGQSVEQIVLPGTRADEAGVLVVPGFLVLGPMLAGTDRIGLVPSTLAPLFTRLWALRTMTLPTEIRPAPLRLLWHVRDDADPVHRWLRRVLTETCAALSASSGALLDSLTAKG